MTLKNPVTFAQLNVPAQLVEVLAVQKITTAFPIQVDTLPSTLAGRHVLGRGKTGSGKTLAFSLPLVARLADATTIDGQTSSSGDDKQNWRDSNRRQKNRKLIRVNKSGVPNPRGLVLAPTRELANQINSVIEPLAKVMGLRTTTIFGGVAQSKQVTALKNGVDIVVACPGRLDDLLKQQILTLENVQVTVLDEADQMADLGFLPVVTRLLKQVPVASQQLLFSATLDNGVDKLVKQFLRNPIMHSVDDATSHVSKMTHHVFWVESVGKPDLIKRLAAGQGKRILFTRTKHQARKLAKKLTDQGIPAVDLHGNLSQNQRDKNLAAFSGDEVRVLVATDVAARGIHVDSVELVVHVDPPMEHKSYLHRSGRTARAGSGGDVVTVVLPEQRKDTEALLRKAAIRVKPVAVHAKSDEVRQLVGELAPYKKPVKKPVSRVSNQRSSQPRNRQPKNKNSNR